MKFRVLGWVCCLHLVSALCAAAGQLPQRIAGEDGMRYGGGVLLGRAEVCTTVLLATDFELGDWQGWSGLDRTVDPMHFWSVTDDPYGYGLVISGRQSLWCGVYTPAAWGCPEGVPGYGNRWEQNVIFSHTVDDNSVTSQVNWTFAIRHEVEDGYDFVFAEWNRGGVWWVAASFTGTALEAFDSGTAIVYDPQDYVGPDQDQIQLRIRFYSDNIYSPQDGDWCTDLGAFQIDDIVVTVNSVVVESEDFENVEASQPGEVSAFGNWVHLLPLGVGDFALLWQNLGDADICRDNATWQAAFIDAGQIPGVGPTYGVPPYDYGPNGYIINWTGGQLGHHNDNLYNSIVSPAIAVAPQAPCSAAIEGVHLSFDVYAHMMLFTDVFWMWEVRSVATGNPGHLLYAPWRSYNYSYYSPNPTYSRRSFDVSSLLEPGCTHMQVALTVFEAGTLWDPLVDLISPAPYYDNIRVVGFPYSGPAIAARAVDLAQDNFPEKERLDLEDLGSNWIRFDMARNIASAAAQVNRPGDSCYVDVTVVRAGYELYDAPRMFFKMRANPLFDSGMRTGLSDPKLFDIAQVGDVISGWTYLEECHDQWGIPIPSRWIYDLPDTAFFFPGDIIHYYIEAEDWDGVAEGTRGVTRLPDDIGFFGDFHGDHGSEFIVRGLPSLSVNDPTQPVSEINPITQPKILWWNDGLGAGGQMQHLAWYDALAGLDYRHTPQRGPGDYDIYDTTAPAALLGNGLGGRANPLLLAGYEAILYTSGTLSAQVLGAGDWNNECGDDIGALSGWLDLGDEESPKKMFMTGDGLATSLSQLSGAGFPAAGDFLQYVMGVMFNASSIVPLIEGQYTPAVKPVPGNGVIDDGRVWLVDGACPVPRSFDAVQAISGKSSKIAYFADPLGDDTYPYAAAVRAINWDTYSHVVYMPYDFQHIDRDNEASAVRRGILEDILKVAFQQTPITSAPDALFAVSNFPNPFNPATTIKLSLPRSGEVSLKVFNVRGELVKTLVHGQMEAGEHSIIWDGTNERGAPVASGIYFHETRAGQEVKVGKLALVK